MDPSRYVEFDSLINRHKHFIKGYCLRYCKFEGDLCVELEQECYIVMWRRLPKLPKQSSPVRELAWVYWSCRSAISHYFRRKQGILTQPIDQHLADTLAAPDESENRALIEDLAQYLTPRERKVFMLTAEGFDPTSIAKKLDIKPESVSQSLYRIILKLRYIVNSKNYER